MGESFGAWQMGDDAALMDVVSSINIACGFHAGDATTMQKTVQIAINKGVAIGAHPSFRDKENFGRANIYLPASEVCDMVKEQIEALANIAVKYNYPLHHVKPHGAL